DYDRLVSAEDCEGHLLPAIESVAPPFDNACVVEVGAGTGRLTRLLVSRAARVIAIEKSPSMLEVARKRLAASDYSNLTLELGDAANLPVQSGLATLAIAGWVFGHQRYWNPENWRTTIARCLSELDRVLVPSGIAIIIETLGTGSTRAAPPSAELADYYDWLERSEGFSRRELSTDYQFSSVDEAAKVTGFFFGD